MSFDILKRITLETLFFPERQLHAERPIYAAPTLSVPTPNLPGILHGQNTRETESLHRMPSPRTIARLMTTDRDTLSRAETVTVAALEAGVPTLVEARTVAEGSHETIPRKTEGDLVPWIERGR